MLPLQARVDLGVMAMKGCSTFLKATESLEPHHQIAYCHILDTRWGGGLTPLQRCSRCILQPQPTGKYTELHLKTVLFQIIQFSISMQFRCQKRFYFEQFSLALVCSLNVKTVQFNINSLNAKTANSRNHGLVVFDPFLFFLQLWANSRVD